MIFSIICVLGLFIGRRLGWALSKAWLYPASSDVGSVESLKDLERCGCSPNKVR